jgi:hypothetical protein
MTFRHPVFFCRNALRFSWLQRIVIGKTDLLGVIFWAQRIVYWQNRSNGHLLGVMFWAQRIVYWQNRSNGHLLGVIFWAQRIAPLRFGVFQFH